MYRKNTPQKSQQSKKCIIGTKKHCSSFPLNISLYPRFPRPCPLTQIGHIFPIMGNVRGCCNGNVGVLVTRVLVNYISFQCPIINDGITNDRAGTNYLLPVNFNKLGNDSIDCFNIVYRTTERESRSYYLICQAILSIEIMENHFRTILNRFFILYIPRRTSKCLQNVNQCNKPFNIDNVSSPILLGYLSRTYVNSAAAPGARSSRDLLSLHFSS